MRRAGQGKFHLIASALLSAYACGTVPTDTECTPTTCAAEGKDCGALGKGCGGSLDCGTCTTDGETCGDGGVANVCGASSCTPITCAAESIAG